ncbi:MAG: protein translocase subunit SecF [Gammaproteobacteria bacterium]|nr:MAG: protein translocase subunit SecF [Gammaproteobacteria bacterium]RTZ60433.1 MAG: protein translocase subunit SecF [Gammaproteobacteria bacterium]
MKIFKNNTHIDFMGMRKIALALSTLVILASIASLFMRGLNLGIDFTGGTLVEVHYAQPVDINDIRGTLADTGFSKAIVQHFGTSSDVMIRLPMDENANSAELSNQLLNKLRAAQGESFARAGPDKVQLCNKNGATAPCYVQLRRVEFVGPQVGKELTEKGGLAILYTLGMIMLYVAWRFEWRFAVGSVAALFHDVLITVGVFSMLGMEFSLPVLAAVLAVIGYSLNDTIVVFDRIRENFRKLRKGAPAEIMNISINQTLSRTILTSLTTLLVLLALFLVGGESIRGFSFALIIGVVVGTYSSIFVASPIVLMLGLTKADLMAVKKENDDRDKPVVEEF